jgi:hypothetical protein
MHTSILFQVIVSASTNELTVGIFGGKKQAGPVIQHRAVLKSDLPANIPIIIKQIFAAHAPAVY